MSKLIKTLLFIIIFSTISNSFGQVNNFRPTQTYDGYILVKERKIDINLNFLVLLDSTIVGSYYYTANQGSLNIAGKLNPDLTFDLNERNEKDQITGYFHGKLMPDYKSAIGKWKNTKGDVYDFQFEISKKESYWDYIKKNRSLFEYTNIKKAIKHKNDVLSIDLANQSLSTLPNNLSNLKKIVSFNLMGNNFKEFPSVLGKLTTLNEISLSSNNIINVGSEIRDLKNLRILILNFNNLKELPKEIGDLTNLLYLEVGSNQLTHLPTEIKNLKKLQELHIEGNKLSDYEKEKIRRLLPNCVVYF